MPQKLPELDAILHSGALSYGKWGHLFEEKLSLFLGVNYLLTTNSYASAIQIALTALDFQQGDEVITSPMSCLASNMPLLTFGLKVVWADIDPTTGTLSPDSVREKISSRTRLIFHNHFCGYVGYVDEINAIGKKYGIPVIDDCVEAFGSKYKGNYTGNLGTDISIYSFQTVRLPNTIDGGAVVFKDKELYTKALLMRDFGIRRNFFRDKNGEISKECDIYMKGYGSTISDISSYIGCLQLEEIDLLLDKQRANAISWKKHLVNEHISCVNLVKTSVPNYWVYGVLADNKKLFIELWRKRGFYVSGVHLPNNYYSIFGKQGVLKGVDEFYSRFVALPCGWWFNISEIC